MAVLVKRRPEPTAGRPPAPAPRARASAYVELTKPGITRLVLVTTAAGFYLASSGAIDWPLFFHTLLGTALAASGTNALNQYLERDVDARMRRTQGRPLPSGRLRPRDAGAFATLLATAGVAYIALFVNVTTAFLVGVCVLGYIFVYTPLKQRTTVATLIGAVPGALPILAGWTAAGGGLDAAGWVLFWILFVWQIPHFLALAWIYRVDYRDGGFAMLSVLDPDGGATARQTLTYTMVLLPISLFPTLLGMTGPFYFFGALLLGTAFLVFAGRLARRRTERRARQLFLASIAYLPALLLMMVVDKIPA